MKRGRRTSWSVPEKDWPKFHEALIAHDAFAQAVFGGLAITGIRVWLRKDGTYTVRVESRSKGERSAVTWQGVVFT